MSDSPDVASSAPASSPPPERRRRWPWLVLGGALLLILALGAGLAAAGPGSSSIPRGTSVLGVQIGGLEPAEAQQRLESDLAPLLDQPLEVRAGGADGDASTVVPSRAGIVFDAEATVRAAEGAQRGPWAAIAGLFSSAGPVDAVLTIDDEALETASQKTADSLGRNVLEGDIVFRRTTVEAVQPASGRSVDPADVAQAVTASWAADERTVDVDSEVTEPTIGQAEVQRALEAIGRPAVSAPVTITVSGTTVSGDPVRETVRLRPAQFTDDLDVVAEGSTLTLTVDGEGLRDSIADVVGGLDAEAKDATFRIVSGRPVVVPSQEGRSIDTDELSRGFAAAVVDDDPRSVNVRLVSVTPNLTTTEARNLGVTEKLSGFTQRFPFAPYRYQNIGTAAERVNGTLLLPGQTFSMNRTVLERTPANGYTEGFVIKDGRLTEDLGGGVSTITTAVWDAAFFAGLERVEQRAHSFYISRYKPGLEATVSWGSLDLKFRNNTGQGVFITAERGRTFVTVTMYGTKKWDVAAEFGPRTNVKPYSRTTDYGPTCTPQDGVNGFTIVVTRVVRENGTVVRREPFKTVYRPASDVTCRSAPKPSTSPKPTASPTPSASPRPT